jgi:tRNA (guanine-N7-)-methyltransferase
VEGKNGMNCLKTIIQSTLRLVWGKASSSLEWQKAHPEINYIGVEMQVSVVSIALDKLIEQPLPNLKLLHVDGSALTKYFADSEVDQIYLNFSDPWPKKTS